jgi:pilus assembly protein Flp/PilA
MKTKVMKFLQDEEGLTIVEYAVAGALISATVAGAFGLLGDAVQLKIEQLTGYIAAGG